MINKRILVLMFLLIFLPLVGCFPAPPNQAPIITSSPITTATVGVLYTYNVNATDPDGDALTYSLIIKPSGMIINSVTGVIFWTPAATHIGNNSVTVKVFDGSLSITQPFTIKVSKPSPTPINHAPVIYSTPITTATVGVTYVYDVNATDPDDDILTYSLDIKPSGMTISSASGLIIWTPTVKGDYAVVVRVFDGALSDTQGFTVKVSKLTPTPINHAPVITSTPGYTATVGVKYIYTIKAIDPDGDAITYSLVSWPAGMTFDAPATINWTPTSTQIGNNSVTVKASDGKLSDIQNFTITVSELAPINQAPIIHSIPHPLMAIVGIVFTYDVEATDPDGDVLIYSLTAYPSGMTIESDTGKITWTPDTTGSYVVSVKASDGELSDTKSFMITVDPVELDYIVVVPKIMSIFVGESDFITSVTAYYNDGTDNLPNNWTYSLNPVGKVSVNVETGEVIAEVAGETTITITYEEGGIPRTDTVKVTVVETIQEAIDAALAGDTIEVPAGMYDENVMIDVEGLTLKSMVEHGAIIKGNVTVKANNVVMRDFEVQSMHLGLYWNGIFLKEVSDCVIENNTILGDVYNAITLDGSNNNLITGNAGTVQYYGMWFNYSDDNEITDNTFSVNAYGGIEFQWSTNNEVIGNTFSDNGYGIVFWNSSGNAITSNYFENNEVHVRDFQGDVDLEDLLIKNYFEPEGAVGVHGGYPAIIVI